MTFVEDETSFTVAESMRINKCNKKHKQLFGRSQNLTEEQLAKFDLRGRRQRPIDATQPWRQRRPTRSPSPVIKYNKTDEPSSVFSIPFSSTLFLLTIFPVTTLHTSFPAPENSVLHTLVVFIQERINPFVA